MTPVIDLYSTAKRGLFVSGEETGTGSEQDVAHGLGRVPTTVFPTVTDSNNAADHVFVEGTHDATNIKIQVESGTLFKVMAH